MKSCLETGTVDSCFLDSLTVTSFFGNAEMRALFNDRSLMQSWLDVEAALARGQASLGLIPSSAARAITSAAVLSEIDTALVARESARTSHPLVPLIRALVKRVGEPAGGFVHLGATTQDVMDTGFVLCARNGLAVVERQCQDLAGVLRRHAIRYRDAVVAGRTHGQQALPTTFGLRAAGWADEVARHRARLKEMMPRFLVGSFGGAVGTMAGYGPQGLALRRAVMQELKLGEAETSWHANQDRFAECIALLAMIGSTAEKLAREVYHLGRTEVAEAFEPQGDGQVGSSTMPHKRNPIQSEAIIGAAMTLRAQVPLALSAMVAQDDRDMGTGMVLWKLLPESFILIGGILERLIAVMDGLHIDAARMRDNLHLTGGLILSEAIMLRLAERIGRESAHHAVSEASQRCLDSGYPFLDCLSEHAAISGRLTKADLALLLQPESYTGLAGAIVDRVLLDGAS